MLEILELHFYLPARRYVLLRIVVQGHFEKFTIIYDKLKYIYSDCCFIGEKIWGIQNVSLLIFLSSS